MGWGLMMAGLESAQGSKVPYGIPCQHRSFERVSNMFARAKKDDLRSEQDAAQVEVIKTPSSIGVKSLAQAMNANKSIISGILKSYQKSPDYTPSVQKADSSS